MDAQAMGRSDRLLVEDRRAELGELGADLPDRRGRGLTLADEEAQAQIPVARRLVVQGEPRRVRPAVLAAVEHGDQVAAEVVLDAVRLVEDSRDSAHGPSSCPVATPLQPKASRAIGRATPSSDAGLQVRQGWTRSQAVVWRYLTHAPRGRVARDAARDQGWGQGAGSESSSSAGVRSGSRARTRSTAMGPT